MTRYLDKLNLRPQERRLVIFVIIVVFVALNWFFVRPYFGELGRTKQHIIDSENDIRKFEDEIQRKSIYINQLSDLSQQGGQVPTEERSTSMTRDIGNLAGAAGMGVTSIVPAGRTGDTRSNAFFEEQSINLTFANTGEQELITFLFGLASQQSLIRVKSMVLQPDQTHMKLGGTITMVESFQKKQPVKPAANAPAPKPAIPPPKTANPAQKTNAVVKPNASSKTNAASKPNPAKPTNPPSKLIPPPGKNTNAPARSSTQPSAPGAAGKTNLLKRAAAPPGK